MIKVSSVKIIFNYRVSVLEKCTYKNVCSTTHDSEYTSNEDDNESDPRLKRLLKTDRWTSYQVDAIGNDIEDMKSFLKQSFL